MDEHASVYAGRGRLTAGGGRYIALAFDQPPPPPFLPLLTQLPSSRMRSNAKSLCTTMLVSARLIRFYERFKCHPPRHSTSSSPLSPRFSSCVTVATEFMIRGGKDRVHVSISLFLRIYGYCIRGHWIRNLSVGQDRIVDRGWASSFEIEENRTDRLLYFISVILSWYTSHELTSIQYGI